MGIREDGTGKDVEINGQRFFITHPQVEVAWFTGIELTKMIGEPISTMAAAAGASDPGQALSGAVRAFLSKLDPSQSFALVKKLFASVEHHGPVGGDVKKSLLTDATIKTVFHGRPGDILRLAGEVISFTHEDFFVAITDGVAEIMTKASAKL